MRTLIRISLMAIVIAVTIVGIQQLGADVAYAQENDTCYNSCEECLDCCADAYADCIDGIEGSCNMFCEFGLSVCAGMCQGGAGCTVGPGECVET